MIFPKLQQMYPEADISFLYDDHKALHTKEVTVLQMLKKSITATAAATATKSGKDGYQTAKDAIATTLQTLLDYDEAIIIHLGEEEEVVVPMMLIPEDELV